MLTIIDYTFPQLRYDMILFIELLIKSALRLQKLFYIISLGKDYLESFKPVFFEGFNCSYIDSEDQVLRSKHPYREKWI